MAASAIAAVNAYSSIHSAMLWRKNPIAKKVLI